MSQPTFPLSSSVLAWLRSFDAVARCKSFTKAASELCVTQGAVSQQVKKLEEQFGRQLIWRGGSGLTLTPDGQHLFAATRQSLELLEEAVARLRTADMGDPINVSSPPSFALLWLTLRLGSFYRAQPKLALRIVGDSSDIDPQRMLHDNIGVAIRYGLLGRNDGAAAPLMDEWLVPVASPQFLSEHSRLDSPENLTGSMLLHDASPWEGASPVEEWSQWLRAADMKVSPAFLTRGTQFNLSQLAVQAALGGQGIAMGHAALVLGYLIQGRLRIPFPLRVKSRAS